MKIKIKRLYEDSVLPTRGTEKSAGLDLYAHLYDSAVICPGETAKIGAGIAVEIPDGYFGGIYARSGLSINKGIRPANCVGVIDSDYRGEISVAVHNDSQAWQIIKPGDRVAQLIIQPYIECEPVEAEALTDTERGSNGFGSTG